MKFSEFEYRRVDLDALKARMAELTQQLANAKNFDEADAALVAMDEAQGHTVGTMVSLANVRRDMDTRDAFYNAEVEFYDEELPNIEEQINAWTKTLLASPFRGEFERKYGNVIFLNAELNERSFAPELVEDMQKENALVSEYTKLVASAQIPFDGKVLTLVQLGPYKLDPDDSVRHAAWKAAGDWWNSQAGELDRIYDELVKVRHSMGKKLGYENYKPLGYDQMLRNCYREEDVEKFRFAVQEHLVPVVKQMYWQQAQRMGFRFPLSYADVDLTFRSGNPRPVGDPQQILEQGSRFYHALSPETAEFWDFMQEHEMMDVESRPGKAGGGYCDMLYTQKAPLIFANFNGTAGDVEVITHEAGHAFAAYLNRNRIPAETVWPGMEACEVHSMSMEFFAEPWSEMFFGKDAKKFLYTHLAGALSFIPYGTMVDHFQHIMYEYPEFNAEERHQVWRELMELYMPWMGPDDVPFYDDGKRWQCQSHIYQRPFYYIDYCLAQTVALQFWAMIQDDPKAAFETYMAYTRLGGSMVFTDLLKEAGLESPFDENCLKNICEKASRYLEAFDLSGLE